MFKSPCLSSISSSTLLLLVSTNLRVSKSHNSHFVQQYRYKANMSTQRSKKGLMDLPTELRFQVIRYLIPKDKTIYMGSIGGLPGDTSSFWGPLRPPCNRDMAPNEILQISAVNNRIRTEALAVYFEDNEFTFLTDWGFQKDFVDMYRTELSFSSIRRFVIHEYDARIYPSYSEFLGMLCNLKDLRLVVPDLICGGEFMLMVLGPGGSLEGVGEEHSPRYLWHLWEMIKYRLPQLKSFTVVILRFADDGIVHDELALQSGFMKFFVRRTLRNDIDARIRHVAWIRD